MSIESEVLEVSHEIKDLNLVALAKLIIAMAAELPDGTLPSKLEELLDFANNILKGRYEQV